MNGLAIVFAAILLEVPIALIINLWRQRTASKAAWLISAVTSAALPARAKRADPGASSRK